jgi:hypothetical protein
MKCTSKTIKTMGIRLAILACCLIHVVSSPLVRAIFSSIHSQFLQRPDASDFLDARILDFH